MESIFSEQGKQAFIDRINKLVPTSQPQWGKMNVSQMFTHCHTALNTSIAGNELKGGRGLVEKVMSALFGKIAKKQILNGDGMKKNMPTAKGFKITVEKDFETEKKKLIEVLNTLVEKSDNKQLAEKHPFFGEMSINDWDRLHTKHLEHHLSQFSV